jgi:hypothetical protein
MIGMSMITQQVQVLLLAIMVIMVIMGTAMIILMLI